jgi:hypothetical protein
MGGGARVDLGGRRDLYHHDGCVVRVGLDWVCYWLML